eukprot:362648-Pyramimonas_sp.AAC.1
MHRGQGQGNERDEPQSGARARGSATRAFCRARFDPEEKACAEHGAIAALGSQPPWAGNADFERQASAAAANARRAGARAASTGGGGAAGA